MSSHLSGQRLIVLDTETTGLEPSQGHRIIEIGCVEVVSRRLTGRNFHVYIQPDREVDAGAIEVHGITNEFLADKPRFADVVDEFLEFIRGAELVIHNAPFDVGFINHEFRLWRDDAQPVEEICGITDTLIMARRMHPGQRNSLDALCKRYGIDNTQRTLHGALLDAEILADVYLSMTGGQVSLSLGGEDSDGGGADGGRGIRRLPADRPRLKVVAPDEEELAQHQAWLDRLEEAGGCVWRQQTESEA